MALSPVAALCGMAAIVYLASSQINQTVKAMLSHGVESCDYRLYNRLMVGEARGLRDS